MLRKIWYLYEGINLAKVACGSSYREKSENSSYSVTVVQAQELPISAGDTMTTNIKPGAVIFTADHKRLAKFYEATTGLTPNFTDDGVTVLGSDIFELVLHSISGALTVSEPPRV